MNRMVSRIFAAILPALHIIVLALIGIASFTDLLDLPGDGGREAAVAVALLAGYLLFAGIASTLVRMAQAMDRMADQLEQRPTPRQAAPGKEPSLTAVPAEPKGRREPTLVAVRPRRES